MKQLHRRCHLVGTGASIFGKSPSSSSPAAVQLHANHDPLLLAHRISWKHLQEPADSARLEEFNGAVRRSWGDMVAAHGGEVRESEAGVSIEVVVTPEETGEVIYGGGVPAARSPSIVDGNADSDHQSDRIGSAGDGSCGGDGLEEEKATSEAVVSSSEVSVAPEETGEDVPGGGVPAARSASVVDGHADSDLRSGRKASAAGGDGLEEEKATPVRIHVPTAPETGEVASASASNEAICSPSRLAPATPPEDIIMGEGGWADRAMEAHRQETAPASGKVSAGDQDDGPTSPKPLAKQIPALSRTKRPAEALAPSSGNGASGAANLYDLGLSIASEMDDATILSEVAKYVGLEYHDQRPQRRTVRQRKAAAAGKAAPVCFSLRLSDEEAMEDVAAVSLPIAVNPAPAVVVVRDRKRRRSRH